MTVSFKSPLFSKYGIPHIFASRHGGVSTGEAFGSLNVSTARTDKNFLCDSAENVYENYRIILSEIGTSPECAVNATQTHSDIILRVSPDDGGKGTTQSGGFMPECDGLLLTRDTSEIGAVCVKTADCVPILFADIVTGSVCAVHAGWRGTVANIAGKAIEAMVNAGSKQSDIIAAIGPCIGMCCYEVGEEVYDAAISALEAKNRKSDNNIIYMKENGKYMINLSAVNRELMLAEGILPEHIDELGMCTCCYRSSSGERLFFSHRGSGGHSGAELSTVGCPK